VALAIVGVAVLVLRVVRRGDPAGALVLTVAGAGTFLYIWKPSITPEQVWAMRRFVPAALPFFVLVAAVAVDRLARSLDRNNRSSVWSRASLAGGAAALVLFPATATWPVRDFQPQAGFRTVVTETCDVIGPNSAVLFAAEDPLKLILPQTIRSWCGVPAASVTDIVTPGRLRRIAQAWDTDDRTLWLLTSVPGIVPRYVPDGEPRYVDSTRNLHELERTISRAPAAYASDKLTVYATRIDP